MYITCNLFFNKWGKNKRIGFTKGLKLLQTVSESFFSTKKTKLSTSLS